MPEAEKDVQMPAYSGSERSGLKARNVIAWGEAPGKHPIQDLRAEGPRYQNEAHATK